jgi:hypothetical protein
MHNFHLNNLMSSLYSSLNFILYLLYLSIIKINDKQAHQEYNQVHRSAQQIFVQYDLSIAIV